MLTREQIQAMPAGFEITTLVAQQVMGHKWLTYLRYPGEQVRFLVSPGLLPDLLKEYDLWEPGGETPARIIMAQHVLPFATGSYNFSHDIADAWQVVEKLTADGWGTSIMYSVLLLSALAGSGHSCGPAAGWVRV